MSSALGFDDLEERSDDEAVEEKEEDDYYFVGELLDGLTLWLDKIFDGTLKRIRITQWPEMTDSISKC